VTVKTLTKLLDTGTQEDIVAASRLSSRTTSGRAGSRWSKWRAAIQIVTRAELHEWVRRLFHERTTQKLSVASLENARGHRLQAARDAPEISEIRRRETAALLGTLVERHLVKVVGRKQVVGRPVPVRHRPASSSNVLASTICPTCRRLRT
jgi:segregation and condensation protein B